MLVICKIATLGVENISKFDLDPENMYMRPSGGYCEVSHQFSIDVRRSGDVKELYFKPSSDIVDVFGVDCLGYRSLI